MTPAERAKFCIANAEQIEAELPPADPDELQPIAYLCADWWRDMAWCAAGGNEKAGRA